MNWAAWGPTIVAIVTAIFTAGLVTGRIRDQEKTLVDHHDRLNSHDTDIRSLSDRQARSEAWREGYSAGSTKARGQEVRS
jgi:hypothetical protein